MMTLVIHFCHNVISHISFILYCRDSYEAENVLISLEKYASYCHRHSNIFSIKLNCAITSQLRGLGEVLIYLFLNIGNIFTVTTRANISKRLILISDSNL